MKTIYIKRPNDKTIEKIECEEYGLSGTFLSTLSKEGTRTYRNIAFITEIGIPKGDKQNGQ